jgi:hypothetical protein
MKRIIFISLVLAMTLILWGLKNSPQLSLVKAKVTEIQKLVHVFDSKKEEAQKLPENIVAEKAQLENLLKTLDAIKASYTVELAEYKKLDAAYTDLIMKSRTHPNRELIKAKQAELDVKFENVTESLKAYQKQSEEIYKFQSENLSRGA